MTPHDPPRPTATHRRSHLHPPPVRQVRRFGDRGPREACSEVPRNSPRARLNRAPPGLRSRWGQEGCRRSPGFDRGGVRGVPQSLGPGCTRPGPGAQVVTAHPGAQEGAQEGQLALHTGPGAGPSEPAHHRPAPPGHRRQGCRAEVTCSRAWGCSRFWTPRPPTQRLRPLARPREPPFPGAHQPQGGGPGRGLAPPLHLPAWPAVLRGPVPRRPGSGEVLARSPDPGLGRPPAPPEPPAAFPSRAGPPPRERALGGGCQRPPASPVPSGPAPPAPRPRRPARSPLSARSPARGALTPASCPSWRRIPAGPSAPERTCLTHKPSPRGPVWAQPPGPAPARETALEGSGSGCFLSAPPGRAPGRTPPGRDPESLTSGHPPPRAAPGAEGRERGGRRGRGRAPRRAPRPGTSPHLPLPSSGKEPTPQGPGQSRPAPRPPTHMLGCRRSRAPPGTTVSSSARAWATARRAALASGKAGIAPAAPRRVPPSVPAHRRPGRALRAACPCAMAQRGRGDKGRSHRCPRRTREPEVAAGAGFGVPPAPGAAETCAPGDTLRSEPRARPAPRAASRPALAPPPGRTPDPTPPTAGPTDPSRPARPACGHAPGAPGPLCPRPGLPPRPQPRSGPHASPPPGPRSPWELPALPGLRAPGSARSK